MAQLMGQNEATAGCEIIGLQTTNHSYGNMAAFTVGQIAMPDGKSHIS